MALPPAYSRRRVALASGVHLSYVVRDPLQRPADGVAQCLVLVHGLGASCSEFYLKSRHLDEHLPEYQLLAPDLLGHGKSGDPESAIEYSMRAQASAVLQAIQKEGVARCNLMGHSMGGAVVVELADLCVAQSIAIQQVIYEEGNLDEGDAFKSGRVAKGGVGVTCALWIARLCGILGVINRQSIKALRACSTSLWEASRSGILLPRLQNLRCPLLFFYGEKNRGKYTSEELLRREGLGDAIVYAPGAGHGMHLEAPEFVFRRTSEFLAKGQ